MYFLHCVPHFDCFGGYFRLK